MRCKPFGIEENTASASDKNSVAMTKVMTN